jgi:hypothetical protein
LEIPSVSPTVGALFNGLACEKDLRNMKRGE